MSGGSPGPFQRVLVHEFVTGGGMADTTGPVKLAAEGHAMRRALAEDLAALDGVRVLMTLDRRYPDEPGPWEIIRVDPGREHDMLDRHTGNVDAAIAIAPESEGILTERACWLEAARCRSLISTPAAVELTSEKLLLGRHLARCGVATPEVYPVFRAEDLPDPDDFPYPAVLKPLDGAGTTSTFLLTGPDECPAEALAFLPGLLQSFVPGTPMSASFLASDDGQHRLVGVGRQRVRIHEQQFHYAGGVVPAGVPEMAGEARRALASVPGLRGWVGVDFVWNEASAQAVVLEINPRLTTSFVGLRRLLPPGTLSGAWLALANGEDASVPEFWREVHHADPVAFDPDGSIRPRGGSP